MIYGIITLVQYALSTLFLCISMVGRTIIRPVCGAFTRHGCSFCPVVNWICTGFIPWKKVLVRRNATASRRIDNRSNLERMFDSNGSNEAKWSSSPLSRSRWRFEGLLFVWEPLSLAEGRKLKQKSKYLAQHPYALVRQRLDVELSKVRPAMYYVNPVHDVEKRSRLISGSDMTSCHWIMVGICQTCDRIGLFHPRLISTHFSRERGRESLHDSPFSFRYWFIMGSYQHVHH